MVELRQSRDQTMMMIAAVVAERSTCSRASVGAVIAHEHRAVSTGYNGAPAGLPHCDHTKPNILDGEAVNGCRLAVHAEANAIVFAARYGLATQDADLFCTHQPCLVCAQLIINAGIKRVVFDHPYRDPAGLELLDRAGIATMRLFVGLLIPTA